MLLIKTKCANVSAVEVGGVYSINDDNERQWRMKYWSVFMGEPQVNVLINSKKAQKYTWNTKKVFIVQNN